MVDNYAMRLSNKNTVRFLVRTVFLSIFKYLPAIPNPFLLRPDQYAPV